MAWAYCHKCGHGLPKPTPHEILKGVMECTCLSDEPLAPDALAIYLTELESRIEALEKNSHEPFDFTHLIERLDRLESRTGRIQDKVYNVSSFDLGGLY